MANIQTVIDSDPKLIPFFVVPTWCINEITPKFGKGSVATRNSSSSAAGEVEVISSNLSLFQKRTTSNSDFINILIHIFILFLLIISVILLIVYF